MTTNIDFTDPKESKDEKIRTGLYDISRKVLLAGIGAAALAQDEVESFINKLTERGELAEKDARKLVKEVIDYRHKIEVDRQKEKENIHQSPAATKSDIEALNARIAELSKKVEELKKD